MIAGFSVFRGVVPRRNRRSKLGLMWAWAPENRLRVPKCRAEALMDKRDSRRLKPTRPRFPSLCPEFESARHEPAIQYSRDVTQRGSVQSSLSQPDAEARGWRSGHTAAAARPKRRPDQRRRWLRLREGKRRRSVPLARCTGLMPGGGRVARPWTKQGSRAAGRSAVLGSGAGRPYPARRPLRRGAGGVAKYRGAGARRGRSGSSGSRKLDLSPLTTNRLREITPRTVRSAVTGFLSK